MQLVHGAVDDCLVDRIGDPVAEPARRETGPYRQDKVALFQVVIDLVSTDTDEQPGGSPGTLPWLSTY